MPITSETVSRIAADFLHQPLAPEDLASTVTTLNALAADMMAFAKFPVGDVEPATEYAPEEDPA